MIAHGLRSDCGGPHKCQSQLSVRVARFRQILNLPKSYTQHNALEFPNGTIVLDLRLGQRANVLQLPAQQTLGKSAAKRGTRPSFNWVHSRNEP
jgi:hypothetical protein